MRRWTIGLTACLLGLLACRTAAPAAGDDEPALFDKADGAQVSERMGREPGIARSFDACPADVFEAERPFWRRFVRDEAPSEKACALHPLDCYRSCTTWSNATACFDLALAFEHHSLDVTVIDKEKLYAVACATGMAAGCTNRAAGIRNGGYRADPFHDAPPERKQACEFRSFRIDCDRRGAWGCAMLGQSYQRGEGVAVDAARARAAFDAACAIAPDFAACAFAKGHRATLDVAAPSPADGGHGD